MTTSTQALSGSHKALRFLLLGIFAFTFVTGLNIALFGIAGIPQDGLIVQASVDNELRFMSIFWVAFGFYALGLSKNIKDNHKAIYGVAFILFLSGIARLLSVFQSGLPIPLFVGAMILEFIIPFIMITLLLKQK